MLRPAIHIALHFFVPAVAASLFFKKCWWKAWIIMLSTMAMDMDHLLADPIFDPNRCSINFHPLHSYPAICVYVLMTVIPKTRIAGAGLLIHIGLDFMDCVWMG